MCVNRDLSEKSPESQIDLANEFCVLHEKFELCLESGKTQ